MEIRSHSNRYKPYSVKKNYSREKRILDREREILRECFTTKEIPECNNNLDLYRAIPIQNRPYLIDSIAMSLPTVYFYLRAEGHLPFPYHLKLALHRGYYPIIADILNFLDHPTSEKEE